MSKVQTENGIVTVNVHNYYSFIHQLKDTEFWNKIKNASYLSIVDACLVDIPDFIFEMTNLKVLDLSKNHINTIPDKICNLHNLQMFTLDHNKIDHISENINELPLIHFSLRNNNLSDLPITINELPVRVLDISYNNFYELPPFFGSFDCLEVLFINNNKNLISIPQDLQFAKKLKKMDISETQIKTIPQWLINGKMQDYGFSLLV